MTGSTRYCGVVEWSEEDQCFIGSYPGIIGPCCHGDNEDDVYRQLRQIVDEWLEIEYEDQKRNAYGQNSHSGSYADRVKSHLTKYRRIQLGIEQDGTWRGKPYPHILPEQLRWLNLIETFRAEVRQSLKETGTRLDKYFHHLNSSQAACINLFWPLLHYAGPDLVVDSLGIGPDKVAYWEFEKVIDRHEKTNFDLFLELKSGAKIFIEFKYTEGKFGRATDNEQHRRKLRDTYAPKLRDFVNPEYLKKEKFFANYQLFRNLYYINPGRDDKVVFLFPRGNVKIAKNVDTVLESAIRNSSVRSMIEIRYLEDVVSDAFARLSKRDFCLRTHLHLYREKYVV